MNNYNFNIDDFITSIEDNNKKEIQLNTYAMKVHIDILFKQSLADYIHSYFSMMIHSYSKNRVLYNVHNTNISIIKQELKVAAYLINNINYLYNFDDKDSALALINIYYYLIMTDFDRIDFVELNSNKGRTIISNYLLDEINLYLDKTIENLSIFSNNQKIFTKELKNEK